MGNPLAAKLSKSTAPVQSHVSWRRAAVLAALATAVVLELDILPVGDWVRNEVARPLAFRYRHARGNDTKLDPRVVIFAHGDGSVGKLRTLDPTLRDWERILARIAARKPRAVILDRVFAMPFGLADARRFDEAVRRYPFPVIAGAFTTPVAIRGRVPLGLEDPGFDLTPLVGQGRLATLRRFPTCTECLAYGPHPDVLPAFARIGHLLYDGDGSVRALVRLKEDRGIFHAALLVSRERRFEGGELFLDGGRVPLDERGRFVVNLSHPSTYARSLSSLAGLLEEEGPPELFPEGAVVVLLPSFYTGHTDTARTVWGSIPGGYVIASVVESVLTGRWIRPVGGSWLWILLGGALGLLLGARTGGLFFWSALVIGPGVIVAGGLSLFAAQDLEIGWLPAALALFAAALAVKVERARLAERRVTLLRQALTGKVAPSDVERMLKTLGPHSLEASNQVVTVMFLDVVGFSVACERQTPHEAFLSLKEVLSGVTRLVHEHGGVVDRTIGDGLLAYFGYRYRDEDPPVKHADQALQCAIAIQQASLRTILNAAEKSEPIYPLRIGINTAAVYVGYLDTSQRPDLTIIGHGVNFAKRLEAACDSFSIMLGATTRDLLVGSASPGLKKRFLQVKHYSQLLEAYECDPFTDEPALRGRGVTAYRAFAGIQRRDVRWPVPEGRVVSVSGDTLQGELVNFSELGLCVASDKYLARGVAMSLSLDTAAGALRERLNTQGLMPLVCEVRWGKSIGTASEERFLLGLIVKNLSPEQRKRLLDELRGELRPAAPIAA